MEMGTHLYYTALHNKSIANVTSYLFCLTGSQNTNCAWGCWKIRKWVGRTNSVCLQWHRSGEHQLHVHGSGNHRNSQGISQLNSVREFKKQNKMESSSAVLDCFFLSKSTCFTAWNTCFNVCCKLYRKPANIHMEHSVTCLCAVVKENSDFISLCVHGDLSELDTETIKYKTQLSLNCLGLHSRLCDGHAVHL